MRMPSRRRAVDTAVPSSSSSKAPVLLHFTDYDTVAAGWVGQARPHHIVPLPPLTASSSSLTAVRASPEDYARAYATPLDALLHLLGTTNATANATSSASAMSSSVAAATNVLRVVCLHEHGLHPHRHWQDGVEAVLQDLLGVTHVCFVAAVHTIPWGIPSPSQNGNKDNYSNGDCSTVCVVYVSATQIQCLVYAQGHSLAHTYSSVALPFHDASSSDTNDDNDDESSKSKPPPRLTTHTVAKAQETLWAELSSTSSTQMPLLLRAVCQSLLACPRESRAAAIRSLCVAGSAVCCGPQFAGRRLSRHLQRYLTNGHTHQPPTMTVSTIEDPATAATTLDAASPTSPRDDVSEVPHVGDFEPTEGDGETEHTTSSSHVWRPDYTHTPLDVTLLRPLAPYVACLEWGRHEPHTSSHPSSQHAWWPWFGASVWANHWHCHDRSRTATTRSRSSSTYSTLTTAAAVPSDRGRLQWKALQDKRQADVQSFVS